MVSLNKNCYWGREGGLVKCAHLDHVGDHREAVGMVGCLQEVPVLQVPMDRVPLKQCTELVSQSD